MSFYSRPYAAIYHYGMPRRSGRYPWGSGDEPYQSISRGELSKRQKKALIKKAKKQQSVPKQPEAKTESKPKSLSEMSNDEIRDMIQRLQLEKQYKDALAALQPKDIPKSQTSKGKSFVKDVVYNAGKKAATEVLTETMKYAGATMINKMVGKQIVNTKVKDEKKDKDKK